MIKFAQKYLRSKNYRCPHRGSIGIKLLLVTVLLGLPTISSAQVSSDILEQYEEAVTTLYENDYERAESLFRSVAEQTCYNDSPPDICFEANMYRVRSFRSDGKSEKARDVLESTEKIIHEKFDGDPNKRVLIYKNRIFLAEDISDFEDVEQWHDGIKEQINSGSLTIKSKARAHVGIASYHDTEGDYEKAIESHKNALGYLKALDKNRSVLEIYNRIHTNKGVAYRRSGMPRDAMEQYKKAQEITQELYGSDHLENARLYNNIGTIHYTLGDMGLAADYFAMTARIMEQNLGPEHSQLGAPLNNAGVTYYAMGNLDKALEYLERAQRVKEANFGTEHMETAVGYSNLGAIYTENEEYEAAEENLVKSINVREKIYNENHPNLIEPHLRLGNLYLQTERVKEAREKFSRALEISNDRLHNSHPQLANSYYYIAASYKAEGGYDKALEYLERSFEVIYGEGFPDRDFDLDRPLADPIKIVDVLKSKSEIHNSLDEPREAYTTITWLTHLIDHMQRSYQDEASKLGLIDQNYDIYTDAIQILYSLYEESGDEKYKEEIYNFAERSRARIALELVQDLSAREFAGVPEEVLKEERALNEKITSLHQELYNLQGEEDSDPETISKIQDSLFYAERELSDFMGNVEQEFPAYYSLKYDQSIMSLSELQEFLKPGQTMVKYVVGDDSGHALVIDRSDYYVVPLDFSGASADQVQKLKKAALDGDTQTYTEKGYLLYQYYFEPVKGYISGDQVIIAADQSLHYLPFEMLLSEEVDHERYDQMPFLINEFSISYAPSATMLGYMNNQRQQHPRNFFALAPFSDGDNFADQFRDSEQGFQNLSPLPLTEYETSSISDLFSERRTWRELLFPHRSEILLNDSATKSQLMEQDLSDYGFIHFSTHAYINEQNPGLSGIALYQGSGDNVAYVDDIYNMQLAADLVVLGACDTGLGSLHRGEGMIGFTRAFIYAGAANLTVSMWRVSDQPTSALMINYYEQIREGHSYSTSLRNAKLSLIENPATAAPRHWAAFVLHGQ